MPAANAEAAVEKQLARIRFDRLKARAGKGRWTGPAEILEDNRRTISGSFKMDNGWAFDDYQRTRELLADWIVKLDKPTASKRRP